jgi:hypothetical protein
LPWWLASALAGAIASTNELATAVNVSRFIEYLPWHPSTDGASCVQKPDLRRGPGEKLTRRSEKFQNAGGGTG